MATGPSGAGPSGPVPLRAFPHPSVVGLQSRERRTDTLDAPDPAATVAPMRILIVGGTKFVGRHIAAAALAAGHSVTLLHRGQTGNDLFPEATHLLADRNEDLREVLAGLAFDATVDVSAYYPHQVEALAAALDGRAGRYVFVSSTAVYTPPLPFGFGEDAPLSRLGPGAPVPTHIDDQTYGQLKVLCEETARSLFGDTTLVIRPTYVVGPWDHTGRFGYWVHRIARGGAVLAPGHADRAMQTIDARDQAAFVIHALESGTAGTFHTVRPPTTFGEMLETIARTVAPAGTELVWVDPDFLITAGQDGSSLPLWYGGVEADAAINGADPRAAVAAGLVNRPLEASVRDVLAVPLTGSGQIPAEEEARLLASWRKTRQG